ncbi:MAG: hypothetical protein K1X66_04730 [Verrucomicrobiae bacterium]|nr:hypothetical protein [Verrucomicrobiae bacterium]
MDQLRFTDTNSADDSQGGAFGLDGNQYLVIIISAIAGIGIVLLLFTGMHMGLGVSAVMGALPVVIATSYIIFFKRGKPAGYDMDLFETNIVGKDFAFNPRAKRSPLIQSSTSEIRKL